mgnify:CR=1 FL=1
MSVETLLEVVEDHMNIEICIAYDNKKFEFLDDEKKKVITEQIKKEKEEAEEAKKNKMKDWSLVKYNTFSSKKIEAQIIL